MHNIKGLQRVLVVLCLVLGLQSCASVPPDVVELSALTGRDLVAVQSSYQTLIHEFYEQLRQRRIDSTTGFLIFCPTCCTGSTGSDGKTEQEKKHG